MRHFPFAAGSVLTAALLLVGCDDSTFELNPSLVSDTVDLGTPVPGNEGLPSAIDITGNGLASIGGGRFPELAEHAGQWDFVVRVRDGELILVPAGVVGLDSRAALTPPVVGETFESLREAPGLGTFRSDTAFALEAGRVYAARSRLVNCGFGQQEQFAKVSPVSVDVAAGRVRLAVTTNQRCGDPRLAMEDDE